MKICLIALMSGVVSAQVALVGVKTPEPVADEASAQPKRIMAAGMPVAGYMLGPGPLDVHAIVVTSKLPKVGDQITVPENAKRVYLPPRQQYALVERNSGEPVAVWAMHKAATTGAAMEPVTVTGAMPHPDLVSFSPRGNAAVLYSQASASLQVVNQLPAEAKLSYALSLSNLGGLSWLAVSDDGVLVVAALSDGRLISSSNGADWNPVHIGFTPNAWSFIPNTHDLAISDAAQKSIVLLPEVGDSTSKPYRMLTQDVQADSLTVTKDGEHLMAANLETGHVWAIDLKTGAVNTSQIPVKMEKLTSLRDGFSFLLSNSDTVSVLRLNTSTQIAESKR
jgi:hypothetical protein